MKCECEFFLYSEQSIEKNMKYLCLMAHVFFFFAVGKAPKGEIVQNCGAIKHYRWTLQLSMHVTQKVFKKMKYKNYKIGMITRFDLYNNHNFPKHVLSWHTAKGLMSSRLMFRNAYIVVRCLWKNIEFYKFIGHLQ